MPTRSSSSITLSRRACFFWSGWWILTASEIWSPTVKTGFRAASASWNTMAMLPPRNFCMSDSRVLRRSAPRNRISPVILAVLGNSPNTAIDDTLLPEPDSPTMPSTSLRYTS